MTANSSDELPIVLAMTGASGAPYAVRLLEVLLQSGQHVHLLISPSGQAVLRQELGLQVNLQRFELPQLLPKYSQNALSREGEAPAEPPPVVEQGPPAIAFDRGGSAGASPSQHAPQHALTGRLTYHQHHDYFTPVASGSFLTRGMVVCPCSGSTLSGIAHGSSQNLVQRAADVHLKERRKLILVPRETPLSLVYLNNLRKVAEAGAVVLPAMPGWYHGVRDLSDLVDFIVARILDQLAIPHQLMKRWGNGSDGP